MKSITKKPLKNKIQSKIQKISANIKIPTENTTKKPDKKKQFM